MTSPSSRWDIFCRVIDNFGDAGVAWRLARILAAEHGMAVSLWLDRPEALAGIAPGVSETIRPPAPGSVAVHRWTATTPATVDGDVVVEAFGCGLPPACLQAMAARPRPPQWFVLEYLSAESWIDSTHGLPSPHPRLPLSRRFWFPGFSNDSGGLLRERGLFAARDNFRRNAAARSALWATLRVPSPANGELRVSLFCYPGAPVTALLDTLAGGGRPVVVLVPEGVASGALEQWTGGAALRPGGGGLARGPLSLHAVPFTAQDDYDRLLWACDLNFVRGEDSFVRAQWGAHPFVWQPYLQPGGAHLTKLAAFVDRYAAGLDAGTATAVRRFWDAWNGAPAAAIGTAWMAFERAGPRLEAHGQAWATRLAALPDLAGGLVAAAGSGV